jgi:hypothetical protein
MVEVALIKVSLLDCIATEVDEWAVVRELNQEIIRCESYPARSYLICSRHETISSMGGLYHSIHVALLRPQVPTRGALPKASRIGRGGARRDRKL